MHVASTAAWLGGFVAIAVLNALAIGLAGPGAGLALLSGVGAVLVRHVLMPLWVLWGIGATVVFILIGVAGLRPVLNRLIAPAHEIRKRLGRQRRLLALNLLVVPSATWAMVFRPT